MKTIQQIYSEYKILPNLQEHQLRVAAIAQILCSHMTDPVDQENIIAACLLHDMGNIIKFDLTYFPELVKPAELDYWQNVKLDYVKKFGLEEHLATELIAREIDAPKIALGYIGQIGFYKLIQNESSNSYEHKICAYADMRVGPFGVVSIEERLVDGRKRYAGRGYTITSEHFEPLAEALRNVEKQVCDKAHLNPDDITDEKVNSLMEGLRNFTFK